MNSSTDIQYYLFMRVVDAMINIARPESEQRRSQPDFVKAEQEIAMELLEPFDIIIKRSEEHLFTGEQLAALHPIVNLVRFIADSWLSGTASKPPIQFGDVEWAQVRQMSRDFVSRFSWDHVPTRDEFDIGWR